jgi:hypothetical protein
MELRLASNLSRKKNNPEATMIIIGIERTFPFPDKDFKPENKELKYGRKVSIK